MSEETVARKPGLGWRYSCRRGVSSILLYWAYCVLPDDHPAVRDLYSLIQAHSGYDDLTTYHVMQLRAEARTEPPRVKAWFLAHPKTKSGLLVLLGLMLFPGPLDILLGDPEIPVDGWRDVVFCIFVLSFGIYLLIIHGWLLLRRIRLPRIALWSISLSASLQASLWITLAVLAYVYVQRVAGEIVGEAPDYKFLGFPKDHRIYWWYAAGLIIIGSIVMAWRSRRRIEQHELRNVKLIGISLLTAVVGFGISVADIWPHTWIDELLGLLSVAMMVSGVARFVLLLRNPAKL